LLETGALGSLGLTQSLVKNVAEEETIKSHNIEMTQVNSNKHAKVKEVFCFSARNKPGKHVTQ
jgi:hypothetical protein